MAIENRSQETDGVVDPATRYAKPGVPINDPVLGYAHKVPVQFSDESDEVFAGRKAMYDSALANAIAIRDNTQTEARRTALKAQYEADLANLDTIDEMNGVKTSKKSSK